MKQIPAFTNKAPTQEDIDASPALQALQSLKYEDEDPAGLLKRYLGDFTKFLAMHLPLIFQEMMIFFC